MKILFFLYQWLIAAPILIVATILTATITIVGTMLGDHKWSPYYPPHIWSRLFCCLLFVKVKVSGRENINKSTSYVFVANHQGAYDIFSIYGYLNVPFRWMMKKSLGKIPFVGSACRHANHIFVDNSTPAATKRTISDAKKILRDGTSLVVFPEGGRTWDGNMRKFKRGAFILANDFHLPIVPVTIDGAFNVLPRTTYNVTPGTINITIHKPIPTGTPVHDMMEISYNTISSSLTK